MAIPSPGASTRIAHRYFPGAGGTPSTRKAPGRSGSVPERRSGAAALGDELG
jgi:hypothetical protein